MVERGQEGTENDIDLEERGYLVSGGMIAEVVNKSETIVLGMTDTHSEVISKSETVIITN